MTLAQRSVQSAGSILGSYPSWTEEELYWDRSLDTVEGRTTISPQHAPTTVSKERSIWRFIGTS